jgi:Tol biopolymer transport system component
VWVVAVDGSQDVKVSGDGHAGDPTWSADGERLAFIRTEVPISGPVFGEIYTVNADGSDLKRLTEIDREAGKADMLPIWSPDGSMIAHLHAENRQVSLRVMRADGSDAKDIFTGEQRINEYFPMIWSPDSKLIALYVGEQHSNDLVIVKADGSGRFELTSDGTAGYSSWSPHGERIAYTSQAGMFVADADGERRVSRVRSARSEESWPTLPVWSPDGKRIAFVWEIGLESHEIRVIDVDGNKEVTIPSDKEITPIISWSPDGSRLTFDEQVNGEGEIFVVNADGTGLTNLTNSPTSEHEPIWSR